MGLDSPGEKCVIEIQRFFSTYVLEEGKDVTSKDCINQQVDRVVVHHLLKWIENEISLNETLKNEKDRRVVLLIEEEEDIIYIDALTTEIQTIFEKGSPNSELKEQLEVKEIFSDAEPYWPNRWHIHILWTKPEIPMQLWYLHQVEAVTIRLPERYPSSFLPDLDVHYGDYYYHRIVDIIPPLIGLLKDLKVLDIEDSHFISLPQTLQFCRKLEELKLAGNSFRSFPGWLLNLPSLKVLSRKGIHFDWRPMSNEVNGPTTARNKTCENAKSFTCDTLYKLSAISVIRNMKLYLTYGDLFDIPNVLLEYIFGVFKTIDICDNCGKLAVVADDICTQDVLTIVAEQIKHEWDRLAACLTISQNTIVSIRHKEAVPYVNKMKECFLLLNNNISWKNLRKQLLRISRPDIIDIVVKESCVNSGWSYNIIAESFIGYTAIPFRGIACSKECAIQAHKRIATLNENYLAKLENEAGSHLQEELPSVLVNKNPPPKSNTNKFTGLFKRVFHIL